MLLLYNTFLKSSIYPCPLRIGTNHIYAIFYNKIKTFRNVTPRKAFIFNSLELLTGIGPVTSALPMRRTTDCATAACFRQTVLSVCRIVLYHRAFYFVNTLSHFPMITFLTVLTSFPDDKLLYFFPERRSIPPDRIVINPDKTSRSQSAISQKSPPHTTLADVLCSST